MRSLDAGVTTVTPRQLNSLRVGFAPGDSLIELLAAHRISTPDADDMNVHRGHLPAMVSRSCSQSPSTTDP